MGLFQPNAVSCPNCNHTFQNNVINGLSLLDAVSRIESRKKMYCRLTLDDLEKFIRQRDIFDPSRKSVLDNFSDFNRDVQTIIGWATEVE